VEAARLGGAHQRVETLSRAGSDDRLLTGRGSGEQGDAEQRHRETERA
jgi:hypothetical protein